MKKTMLALALCLLALPAAADWSGDRMNAQIDQTNFVVNNGCSGTLIDGKDRYILTAAHCVDAQYKTIEREEITNDGEVKKKEVRVLIQGTVKQIAFNDNGNEIREITYRTKMVVVDKFRDLAVVQVVAPIPNTVVSKIACGDVKRGDRVKIVGNPTMLYSSVVEGIVSSVERDYSAINFGETEQADKGLMQISGGVIGGNSGGSVYNDDGELIGVPVIADRARETLGFAVPVWAIRDFLKAKPELKGLVARCDPPPKPPAAMKRRH